MVTFADADEMGVRVRHGARPRERERAASRRENPAGESSGVGGREGGHKFSIEAVNPRGDRQGLVGVVESPQGIDTSRMEELLQGGENSGVPSKGEGVPGEDGRGYGGDGNPPTTRATKARVASGGNKGMTHRPRPAPPPIPQRGTAVGVDSKLTLHRHPNGADGARPDRASEYSLLVTEEPAGDPAATGTQIRK